MNTENYVLNDLERDLLMELQYNFPLTPTPYTDVADKLGIDVNSTLKVLRNLKEVGILKRVGFYFNYRSQGHVASLVAFSAGDSYEKIADILRRDPLVTHNFLRDHEEYNVWAVIKRGSREELKTYVESIARECGISEWVFLWSRKTFKLSVKFDLYRGISRSGRYSKVVENPPKPEDLGIDISIPRLARTLKLVERPYQYIGERVGLKEDEVLNIVKELLERGVLGDPGAAVEGKKVGFKENAMVVMEPYDDGYSLCQCATELPFTTHVVLRDPEPPEAWRHICYFMVHAVDREKIWEAVEEARERCNPKDLKAIFSIKDLKPQVIR